MRIREQSRVKSEENVSLGLKALGSLTSYRLSLLGFPTASLCRPEALFFPAEAGSRVSGRPLKQTPSLLGRHWQMGSTFPVGGSGARLQQADCGLGGDPGLACSARTPRS